MDRTEVVIEATTVKELTQKQALYQYWHTTRAEKSTFRFGKVTSLYLSRLQRQFAGEFISRRRFIYLREILYLDELIFLKRVEKVSLYPLIPTQMFDFCDRGRKSLAF